MHGVHEKCALLAGMTRGAALETANRLDTWIREALKLRPNASPQSKMVH